ncbi:tetratricopeptide repeat protein [Bacillus salipaludis]|uniref:tetratricopeptide repeat protein n=1 Tax=Bacillus salipaludis TaxID=2547811 RepID=UPI002E1E2376|nr:tetratricopeptide repeat protein [Bacillus salipaludis]
MQLEIKHDALEPANRTEKKEKEKKDRFSWWQSLIILMLTLAICLGSGYYISSKYLWNKNANELNKQIEYFKSEVNKNPNDPKMRVQLGFSYFLKHDYDHAIKEYKTAKDLDINYFDAYLNLSIVYDKENRTDDALQMAIKAVKISPQDYKGQLLKGRSYRKLKMYKEANKALEEAIRLKPGNTDIIYEVGLVAESQGKVKEAEKIYKEVLSYDPTYKPAINRLDRLNKN